MHVVFKVRREEVREVVLKVEEMGVRKMVVFKVRRAGVKEVVVSIFRREEVRDEAALKVR